VDRSEGNDDELYPIAPVPAHERQWRHPSEIGEQAWVASEPPLTIGRGLSAATGVIGSVLALAVLWTMLSTHAGRNAGVGVRSTVANTSGFGSPSSAPALAPTPTDAAPSSTVVTTTSAPSSSEPSTSVSVTPTSERPAPLPTYAVTVGTSVEPVAVAVAVNGGTLIITTASAVSNDNTVALLLPNGEVEQAQVLLVDERSGFAVLVHEPGASMASFTVATDVRPGDELHFYGSDDSSAIVQDDGSIATTGTDPKAPIAGLPEGTPVVNQRGELVALCSHANGTATLVSLQHLDSLQKALAREAGNKVWMGVMLGVVDGALVVESVNDVGPAALAGVRPGDVLRSVNGVDVADATDVGATLAALQPGDTVTVVIVRDGATQSIDVVLAVPRATL
jgi:S1-C subfamily serine protease